MALFKTLDDPDVLEQAEKDPKGLLYRDEPTILDEVQRQPSIFLTVKYLVDQSKGKRKFILSGSGNISLRSTPRESLAGRAQYLHLTPFCMAELFPRKHRDLFHLLLAGEEVPEISSENGTDYFKAVWQGGLPRIVQTRSYSSKIELFSGYVDTYLKRDIQDLVKVRYPENFRRLMSALAKATGWESVQEELARSCGEERSNVSRYISLMKETELLSELRGYFRKSEKAYRQAKYYWFDSGVACFLAGIHTVSDLKKQTVKGRYFENFIFQQLMAHASLDVIRPELFYWKPKQGEGEVDFVYKKGDRMVPIEVKSQATLTFRDTQSVQKFMETHPESSRGAIVYTGTKLYPIASGIYAVPWSLL